MKYTQEQIDKLYALNGEETLYYNITRHTFRGFKLLRFCKQEELYKEKAYSAQTLETIEDLPIEGVEEAVTLLKLKNLNVESDVQYFARLKSDKHEFYKVSFGEEMPKTFKIYAMDAVVLNHIYSKFEQEENN